MLTDISSILIPATISFVLGILITPVLTNYLYKHKAWKKRAGKVALSGETASEFNRLHQTNEVRAPRMGGIVVWASVLLTTIGVALLAFIAPHTPYLNGLNFLNRNQTWIPLATLIVGSFAGLIDDLMVIRPSAETPKFLASCVRGLRK